MSKLEKGKSEFLSLYNEFERRKKISGLKESKKTLILSSDVYNSMLNNKVFKVKVDKVVKEGKKYNIDLIVKG